MLSKLLNIGKKAKMPAAELAAEAQKKDYLNKLLGYDIDERFKNIHRGFVLEDPLDDAAMWGALALAAGGVGGQALAPKEQVIQAEPGLMVRPAPGYVVEYQ